jgi:hypothetical protein
MDFVDGTSTLQRREGERFYTCPKKLTIRNYLVKTGTFRIWNIAVTTQTEYSSLGNWNIRFYLVQWDVECMWLLCFTHLTWFLGYVKYWDFIGNPYCIPLNRAVCLYSRLNIKYISSTWACTRLIVVTSLSFDFMRIATCDLALVLTFRGYDLEYFKSYDQFSLLIFKPLYILIQ